MGHILFAIHGSHPCVAVERALELKRQPYRVVERIPAVHVPQQWLRFRQITVPALELGNGERIVGSRAILRRLDQLVPAPPLVPADPAARERVLAAERWGDEVLQPAVRRLFWVGVGRRPGAFASYAAGSALPIPDFAARMSLPFIGRAARWRHGAGDDRARADLDALPGWIDRIDGWIDDGVIGGEQPNAADLQIGSSLGMLSTFADLRPLLDARPAGELRRRLFPDYDGEMPAGTYALTTRSAPLAASA
ncbi:glutathione S-transferase N-terminal domain-containing protein [Conexibacter arvalis]|uniref:Glutathione S-transferase n=1 Tax=Conexibacter arvalis TaxID=912552 RepID=A0A840IFA9_9ACTN|nr:glutathione S-transferase family protein [Conexibacter arvalis]MBB4662630.1 glutathione S-transferase [Conexibacter arvalis]